ncbi:hypothetical protein ACOSP7_026413 [Xanthoceras sorbifolium]
MIHLREAMINVCSSIPILGCVMGTFFQFLTSEFESAPVVSMISSTNDHDQEIKIMDNFDVETSANAAAQKHFRQLQHIRTT